MMKDFFIIISCSFLFNLSILAQPTGLKGRVLDEVTGQGIPGVNVSIQDTYLSVLTNASGDFSFPNSLLPLGEGFLILQKDSYDTRIFPIIINEGKILQLEYLYLSLSYNFIEERINSIFVSDDDLDSAYTISNNISSLLQSSNDPFNKIAAFDFGIAFFNPRGYDSKYSSVLINGIRMNKILDGRPHWNNWGGLSDLSRNQEFINSLTSNDFSFGDIGGTTHIDMRASQYRPGGRASFGFSNSSYKSRFMLSYHTGIMQNNWAISSMISRRFASEGYISGALYEANSIILSIEKILTPQHSLSFIGFSAQNRKARSSAHTKEVYDLKGTRYNANWGWQNKNIESSKRTKRSSRIQNIHEPVLMLGHNWSLNKNTSISSNLSYQFGSWGNTNLGFNKSSNPNPTYYQYLPSYYLNTEVDPNHVMIQKLQNQFIEDGQIDWNAMYYDNIMYQGTSRYYLYEDRKDDNQFSLSSILISHLDELKLSVGLKYRNLISRNFSKMLDLLGSEAYLDIDSYNTGDTAQSDLYNPNRLVREQDTFKYNYNLYGKEAQAFFQIHLDKKRIEYYFATRAGITSYQREGMYKNGAYAENSFGKSQTLHFTDIAVKFGMTYKITGRHILGLNTGYSLKAPDLRTTFSNPRQNNEIVKGIVAEKINNIDLNYFINLPILTSRLTAYYTRVNDGSQVSFYYADGISGLGNNTTSAFVQEALTNVSKEYLGLELGIEIDILPSLKLNSALAIGQHIYANNPNLYINSSDFNEELSYGNTYLKNYKLANGPQQAFHIGFEYRNPNYWFFGLSLNYFSKSYIGISSIRRTQNFYMDHTGFPFIDYDKSTARKLLKQELLEDFKVVNMRLGKSWRINKRFISLFASVNNLLNETYRTGGFEQERTTDYLILKADNDKGSPMFAPKYWYANGLSYNLSLNYKF